MTSKSKKKPKETHPLRHKLIQLAKLTFVLGLLYFLVQKGFISLQATRQALSQWEEILPAIGGLCITMILGVFRWRWLLGAQDIELSWLRTCELTLIGNFFNIALPGAVSGDFVKAFYVGNEIKGQRARAFGSILFDRVAGLSALVLLSAAALIIGMKEFANTPLLAAIQFTMGTAALSVIVFYGYLFLVRERHDPFLKALRHFEKKLPKLSSITRIYESLRHYHNHRITVLKVLTISVLIHVIVGWSCLRFATALNSGDLSLLSVYVIVPLGLLITAIPVAPAGMGTGNVAFLYLFGLIGTQRGADIFSLYALTNILIGAVGGLVYFRFKGQNQLPDLTENLN